MVRVTRKKNGNFSLVVGKKSFPMTLEESKLLVDKLNKAHVNHEAIESAKRIINKFGSKALKKALDETGLGNSPSMLSMLVRIGAKLESNDYEIEKLGG